MIRAGIPWVLSICTLLVGLSVVFSTAPAHAACQKYVGTVCLDKKEPAPKKKAVVKPKAKKKTTVKSKSKTVAAPTTRLRDWDAYDWGEMSGKHQKLWSVLGWNASSWSGARAGPATERTRWSKLSTRHRNAATQLGYSQKTWDAVVKD